MQDSASNDNPRSIAMKDFLMATSRYTMKYRDQAVVIKFSGKVFNDPNQIREIAEQAIILKQLGCNVVLVHGGGDQLDDALKDKGLYREKENGVRPTDEKGLEVVEDVLSLLNRSVVRALNRAATTAGSPVRGQSKAGYDSGMINAVPLKELTGQVDSVNVSVLNHLESGKNLIVPVVYPVCGSETGQIYNVNADDVAAELAIALKAKRLIFCSDVPAVQDKAQQRIAQIVTDHIDDLIADGTVTGGMIPKLKSCQKVAERLDNGGVVILNPKDIADELMTQDGAGTLIRKPKTSTGNAAELKRKPA